MNVAAVTRLKKVREDGVEILIALIKAGTLKGVKAAIKKEKAWVPLLLEAVAPFGPQAARFEPLSPMDREESASIHHVQFLSPEHCEYALCHAVRMYRLNKLFEKFPVTMPRGKTGPTPIEHLEALKTARELIQTGATEGNKSEAARRAIEKHGRGLHHSDGAAISAIRKKI